MALTLIVLPLKDINYELHIINMSQIVIITVPCCYKMLVFKLVAILLLIYFTNLAKADNYADKVYNYDSYQYPDYEYPDLSKYIVSYVWVFFALSLNAVVCAF